MKATSGYSSPPRRCRCTGCTRSRVGQGQALVDADHLDVQVAGALDHGQADVVIQPEAVARAELGIGLPGAHPQSRAQGFHAVHVAGLVRIHAAVQQQPFGACHLVDDAPHRVRGLDGPPARRRRGRHKRQHHHVRVGIQEDVLDELVRAQALQIAQRIVVARRAVRLRHAGERPGEVGNLLQPLAGRVHIVALHVEDELVAAQPGVGKLPVERRVRGQFEEAGGFAGGRVHLVHGQQRGGCAAAGLQEVPPVALQPAGVGVSRRQRRAVAEAVGR
jgi:hypothetical protein